MGIPVEFQEYKELAPHERERAFQAEIIIPLLQRAGYSVVWDNHGRNEKGNDVIFAEIDRLGGMVYYGMQVKYRDDIGKSESQGLIDDVREAFACPFDEPRRGERGHISRFYIANAGGISPDVADSVRQSVVPWTPASNVRFLDGGTLINLSRWAAYNGGVLIKERLTGLRLEMQWNQAVAKNFLRACDEQLNRGGAKPVGRLRDVATSAYLVAPFALDRIDTNAVIQYWNAVLIVNQMLGVIVAPLMGKEARISGLTLLGQSVQQMDECQKTLVPAIDALLRDLSPIH